jgi:hypothetical protein
MVAESVGAVARRPVSILRPRLLGTIGMLAAPMMLIEGIYRSLMHLPPDKDDIFVGLIEALYVIGWMCTTVGMRQLRATGSGKGSAVVFAIQIIGQTLALLFALAALVRWTAFTTTPLFGIADLAWPFSHLFMLVVGVFVWKAGVWKGWQRVAPFVCSGGLLGLFALMPLVGRDAAVPVFGIGVTAGFLLLGYAVRTGEEAPSGGA